MDLIMRALPSFAIIAIIFLSGCAAMQSTPQHYTGTQGGYASIAMGITKNSARSPLYRFYIKEKSEPRQKYQFALLLDNAFNQDTPDIITDEKEVLIMAKRLKPGQYSIIGWEASVNGLGVFHSRSDFNIDFEIQEGETTFLNQFLFHTIWEEGMFGLAQRPANFLLLKGDMNNEDKTIAKNKIERITIPRG